MLLLFFFLLLRESCEEILLLLVFSLVTGVGMAEAEVGEAVVYAILFFFNAELSLPQAPSFLLCQALAIVKQCIGKPDG